MITHDQSDGKSPSRFALFALIVTVHTALVFMALHWATRLQLRRDEPLVFLVIPNDAPVSVLEPPASDIPRKQIPPQAIVLPSIPPKGEPPKEPEHPAKIDWNAEAVSQAEQQEQLSMGQQPRALDKHGQGLDLNGGLGPDKAKGPQFGWYNARLHRFEYQPGGGMVIHLNDRCIVVLMPFPMPFCGIGKIPIRGDLFDHMHDEPQQGGNAANAVP
jgi:hypothetical protein